MDAADQRSSVSANLSVRSRFRAIPESAVVNRGRRRRKRGPRISRSGDTQVAPFLVRAIGLTYTYMYIYVCVSIHTYTYKTGYLRQPTRVKVAEMPNVATRYDSLIRLSRIEIKVRSHSIVADSKLRSLASSISLMRKTCTIYGGKLRRHINCYERTISSRYLIKVYTI